MDRLGRLSVWIVVSWFLLAMQYVHNVTERFQSGCNRKMIQYEEAIGHWGFPVKPKNRDGCAQLDGEEQHEFLLHTLLSNAQVPKMKSQLLQCSKLEWIDPYIQTERRSGKAIGSELVSANCSLASSSVSNLAKIGMKKGIFFCSRLTENMILDGRGEYHRDGFCIHADVELGCKKKF